MGQSVEVTLAITSKFEDTMTFSNMFVHFTGDSIVQKFKHNSSNGSNGSSNSDSDSIQSSSLVFEYNKPMMFTFNCYISESCLNSSVAQDSYLGIEKVTLLTAHHY